METKGAKRFRTLQYLVKMSTTCVIHLSPRIICIEIPTIQDRGIIPTSHKEIKAKIDKILLLDFSNSF